MSVVTPQVNLLEGRREALAKQQLAVAKSRFVVFVALIGYMGLVVAIFLVQGFIGLKINKVQGTINQEELALAKLKPVEEKYVVVMNKLKLVTDFLQARGKAREMLMTIYNSLPAGIQLAKVEVGGNVDWINIQAGAKDMVTMVAYLTIVEDQVTAGTFKKITLSGVTLDKDGVYSIKSDYTLNE